MPRKNVLDTLGDNTEPTPAEVEMVKPSSDYEAQVARESMMAGRRAMQAAEGEVKQVSPPLLEPKPPAPIPQPPPPSAAAVEVVPSFKEDDELMKAAGWIFDHLGSLAWEWRVKLDAMVEERGLTKSQCILALIANTLDKNEHMYIPPDHPYFAATHMAGGTSFTCMECGEIGQRYYAGQPALHAEADKNCGARFHARSEADQQELMRLNGRGD